MNKRRFRLSWAAIAVSTLSVMAVGVLAGSPVWLGKADGETIYTQSLDSTTSLSGLNSSTYASGLAVSRFTTWDFAYAKSSSGKLCKLQGTSESAGYIANDSTTPLTGVTEFSAVAQGNGMALYACSTFSGEYTLLASGTTSIDKTLSNTNYVFFKLINTSSAYITVTSISVNYSCQAPSTVDDGIAIEDVEVGVNAVSTLAITYGSDMEASDRYLSFSSTSNCAFVGTSTSSGYSYTVEGLLAGAETEVTATAGNGSTTTFTVSTSADTYVNTSSYDDSSWFSTLTAPSLTSTSSSFVRGVDCSEVYKNELCGAKYYNSNGIREDVFQILKNNGVTHARFRLWVDPFTTSGAAYGGGLCDEATVLAMAKRAYRAGLKILVDFHLSDFWAHPSQMVMPKAWYASCTTAAQCVAQIRTYTAGVIQDFLNAGVSVDIAQIGNEVTSGIFYQYPSSTNAGVSVTSDSNPYYIQNATVFGSSSAISGCPWSSFTNGLTNLRNYIIAGANGVHDADSGVKIAVHVANSFSGSTWAYGFFRDYLASIASYIDIIGLSYYPMYHGTVSEMKSVISSFASNSTWSSKKLMILENSYGYTTWSDGGAYSNQFTAVSDYATSVQGQANEIAAVCNAIISVFGAANTGIFEWAGCWTPQSGCGWAGTGTKNTWGNQALFSFKGKILPSVAATFGRFTS